MGFNKELIRTGIIRKELGKVYNELLNLRQDADYRDLRNVDGAVVLPLFDKVEELIDKME